MINRKIFCKSGPWTGRHGKSCRGNQMSRTSNDRTAQAFPHGATICKFTTFSGNASLRFKLLAYPKYGWIVSYPTKTTYELVYNTNRSKHNDTDKTLMPVIAASPCRAPKSVGAAKGACGHFRSWKQSWCLGVTSY